MNTENRTEAPLVSVIIPAYNASRYIAEALDSVFAQTFKDYETVVVNDGSADTPALEQVLAAYDDRIVYLKQENQGVSKARNTGIHYARGQFIALLDSDDRWEPGFLQQQVSMFQSNPNLDLVFSDSILFGATPLNGRRFMSVYPSSRPVTLAKLLNGDATVITSCVVARKTALLEAGLFDETRHYSEDFDLWCRMAAIGKQIDFSPEPLGRRRIGTGVTTNGIALTTNAISVFNKHRTLPGITAEHISIIDRRVPEYEAVLNLHLGKKYLAEKRYKEAGDCFAKANVYYKRWKLRAVLLLIRTLPGLARWIYCNARSRQAATA